MPIDDDRPYCQYAAINGQRCAKCMCPEALSKALKQQEVEVKIEDDKPHQQY